MELKILGGSTKYVYTGFDYGFIWYWCFSSIITRKNNPFGIIITSIFYAALEIGGQTLQIDYKLDKEIVYIIQALIIILVAAENALKYFLNRKKGE